MSHSYEVTVGDLVFTVSFTCTPEMDDAEIEEVVLNGEPVDTSSLYVRVLRRESTGITTIAESLLKSNKVFVLLEEYLLDEAMERLGEDGGSAHEDAACYAEYQNDIAREEGLI